ncbi:MAG: hypothetical protein R3B70_19465 [Polyangiaceae bacterium]
MERTPSGGKRVERAKRMSDKAEVEKIARQIAERFGETGERPLQQIERMVRLMGTAWASDVAEQASKEITSSGPLTLRADGSPRVKSGVFFAIARRAAYDLVMKGTLNRRDFYSTFCWRERKPREPKPMLPQRRPPKEAAQRPAFSAKPKQQQGANAPRRKAPPPAEVYSFRRPVR